MKFRQAIPCLVVEVGQREDSAPFAPSVWLEPIAGDGKAIRLDITVLEAREFGALLGQEITVQVEVNT